MVFSTTPTMVAHGVFASGVPNAFHQRRSDKRPRRCAKREAHSQLPPATDGAHEKKSSDIQTGNEQHHQHRVGEDVNQRPAGSDCLILQRFDMRGDVDLFELWWEVAHDLLRDAARILCRLLYVHTGVETADHVVAPVGRAGWRQLIRRETHRYPELGLIQAAGDQWEFEVAGHDADDDIGLAIKQDFATEDPRVGVKAALPHAVAEHCNGCMPVVLLVCEDAAHQRRDAECGKDSGGHARSIHSCRLAAAGEFVAASRITAQG